MLFHDVERLYLLEDENKKYFSICTDFEFGIIVHRERKECRMNKIAIETNVFTPMPVTLVGANVGGKANFMTVAWITRVNTRPPMLALAINRARHTHLGIRETETFSVCLPSADMVENTDYCGLVSGRDMSRQSDNVLN
jgi:flavin reductase (DIM6/NTAB) family NADH-FMN oxidoreductase RutF